MSTPTVQSPPWWRPRTINPLENNAQRVPYVSYPHRRANTCLTAMSPNAATHRLAGTPLRHERYARSKPSLSAGNAIWEMAHPVGAPSNSLFNILADWESILSETSLGNSAPANLNEEEQEQQDEARDRSSSKGTMAARLYKGGARHGKR
jgi:hypothetical protein